MIVEHRRADRRAHDAQILRAFVVTMAGVWITALVLVWYVMPINVPEAVPVITIVAARTGRKAPGTEKDVYLAIRENGNYYWSGEPVGPREIARRLQTLSLKPQQWPQQQVQVRVEMSTPFLAVRRLVRIAQNAGIPRLVFMVRIAEGAVVAAD